MEIKAQIQVLYHLIFQNLFSQLNLFLTLPILAMHKTLRALFYKHFYHFLYHHFILLSEKSPHKKQPIGSHLLPFPLIIDHISHAFFTEKTHPTFLKQS